MAAIAPAPYGATYAASKICGDYVAWGLTEELKKYKVDVCTWRAAGVSTKIIGNEAPDGCAVVTPEAYVAAAFNKCTSGVHSGVPCHEIMHLLITNHKDIWPIESVMWLFSKLFGNAPEVLKKTSQASVAPAEDK